MGSKRENKGRIVVGNVTIRTVDGSMIRGKINLGENERISDVMVKGESPYLVVFDAATANTEGKVFVVNKRHIIWVEPEAE